MKNALFLILACLLLTVQALAQQQKTPAKAHPNLVLTQGGVKAIAGNATRYELLRNSYGKIKRDTDKALQAKMDVPVPKDAGGGATHNQHTRNYKTMYNAGVVYQVTKDPQYAQYVRDMLFQYAAMYKTLPLHPAATSKTPGKIFWQSLNDCNWLVYTIQAYDCIYDFLPKADIARLNQELFYPMVRFLSEESAPTFNRVHNHGTWAVAAVGMTGYVLGDQDLVDKALKGLAKDGKGGFLLQLEELFSPDGYYTEGPYYQRYAMMPFILFAKAIDNNQPDYKIFSYRDSVLLKAVHAVLQLTYKDAFFPFNDAIKTENINGDELVHAVNITYDITGDETLLSIAEKQGRVIMSEAGVKVAAGLSKGLDEPYVLKSMNLSDGAAGNEGGVGILRSGPGENHTAVLLKYTSHGLSHGHYDKLSLMLYDNGQEILQDYGAVRFVNDASKNGGRYLPENETWAKQTIAHNTVVVDGKSHFDGKIKVSEKSAPTKLLFEAADPQVQLIGAVIQDAYEGVGLKRFTVLLKDPAFAFPVVLDIFDVASKAPHQYDLPFYYMGNMTGSSFGNLPAPENNSTTLGNANGYQHLYLTGTGKPQGKSAQVTWQNNNRYYTLSTTTSPDTEVLFVQLGANDPDQNLRNEAGIILRQPSATSHTFVSLLEPHGSFDAKTQKAQNAASQVKAVAVVASSADAIAVELELAGGVRKVLLLALNNTGAASHQLSIDGKNISWSKPYWFGNKEELKARL